MPGHGCSRRPGSEEFLRISEIFGMFTFTNWGVEDPLLMDLQKIG
jgi:hypothetical protein